MCKISRKNSKRLLRKWQITLGDTFFATHCMYSVHTWCTWHKKWWQYDVFFTDQLPGGFSLALQNVDAKQRQALSEEELLLRSAAVDQRCSGAEQKTNTEEVVSLTKKRLLVNPWMSILIFSIYCFFVPLFVNLLFFFVFMESVLEKSLRLS